jgi:polyhydroxybutyrate depolymerase
VRVPAVIVLVAILAGVAAGSGGDESATAANCIRSTGRHTVGGTLTYVPQNLSQQPQAPPPLLLAFHGLRMQATSMESMTAFDDLASKRGFIVAYPSATNAQKWQLNDHDGDDDVNHVRWLVDELVARTCADPNRVYLTGFSNGASFAFRAGCDLDDKVAAVAPVSGDYHSQDECAAGAMPTLEVHGTDPWTKTVLRLLQEMKGRNGCAQRGVSSRIAPGVSHTTWAGCNLERIYNKTVAHEWAQTGAYNTSAEVWNFVSRYSRTP